MRRINKIIILIICMVSLLFMMDMKGQTEIELKIDSIFNDFQKERFLVSGFYEESGWLMELPSGHSVTKTFLLRQADSLASCGMDAVPALFKWAMSDELYIRYIAVSSLSLLTGIAQPIPIFEKEDPEGERYKAIQTWKAWYEKQKENE